MQAKEIRKLTCWSAAGRFFHACFWLAQTVPYFFSRVSHLLSSNGSENLLGGRNGLLNVLFSVRQRSKASLVLRGGQVDSLAELNSTVHAEPFESCVLTSFTPEIQKKIHHLPLHKTTEFLQHLHPFYIHIFLVNTSPAFWSIIRCHLANFSVSLFVASAKQVTGPSQKKKPNMPLM